MGLRRVSAAAPFILALAACGAQKQTARPVASLVHAATLDTSKAGADKPAQVGTTRSEGGITLREIFIDSTTGPDTTEYDERLSELLPEGPPVYTPAANPEDERLALRDLENAEYHFAAPGLLHKGKLVIPAVKAEHVTLTSSRNAEGTDFAAFLCKVQNFPPTCWLIRPSGVERWDRDLHGNLDPIWAGPNLVRVDTWGPTDPRSRFAKEGDLGTITVRVGDGPPLKLKVPWTIHPPTPKLVASDGHWLLETPNDVIRDGESQKAALGYADAFALNLLADKPLYFFSKGGHVGVNYDGRELAVTYDEVLARACCSTGGFNPMEHGRDVVFHAKRGGKYYVVVASSAN